MAEHLQEIPYQRNIPLSIYRFHINQFKGTKNTIGKTDFERHVVNSQEAISQLFYIPSR